MMATMPMMGFLVNWVLRKVVPPKGALAFIAMSFVGVILVVSDGSLSSLLAHPSDFGPDALLLFAAPCWVIYTSGATYFPTWSPIKYTAITTVLGLASASVITAVILATGGVPVPTAHAVTSILPELAYMSIIAGFVGVLGWNFGNKYLGPLNGVLFMDVVPITAFIVSALTGVIPAGMRVAGASLTALALALVLNNLYLRKVTKRTAAEAAAKKSAVTPAAAEKPAPVTAGR